MMGLQHSATDGPAAGGLARPHQSRGDRLRRQAVDLNSVISSVRGFYATNVVGRILAADGRTQVAHNYENIPGAIPIPATLSLELGRVIDEQQRTLAIDSSPTILSQIGRPLLDDFEKSALASLRAQPDQRLLTNHRPS